MTSRTLIVTLTPNPSLDLASDAPAVHPVRKIRTRHERFDPGGGGVNVARILREMGGDTLAVTLTGGVVGRYLEELMDAAGLPRRSVPIEGHTRLSHIVQDVSTGLEYRFVPEGPTVSPAEWQAALQALAEAGGAWLVLSGSLPPGLPPEALAAAARQALARGQRVVADSSGPAFAAVLALGGLDLVKPSLGEFEAFLGRRLPDAAAQDEAAMALARSGASRLVAVSLGHRGAVLASAERAWRLPAPDVPVRGASGAGDSFVAAMTLSLARGERPEDALAWGSAAGGATVSQPGTAHARRADVEALYQRLRPLLD
jgi:6-phosphofructokinase 2